MKKLIFKSGRGPARAMRTAQRALPVLAAALWLAGCAVRTAPPGVSAPITGFVSAGAATTRRFATAGPVSPV